LVESSPPDPFVMQTVKRPCSFDLHIVWLASVKRFQRKVREIRAIRPRPSTRLQRRAAVRNCPKHKRKYTHQITEVLRPGLNWRQQNPLVGGRKSGQHANIVTKRTLDPKEQMPQVEATECRLLGPMTGESQAPQRRSRPRDPDVAFRKTLRNTSWRQKNRGQGSISLALWLMEGAHDEPREMHR
jgi:hypothetical protein